MPMGRMIERVMVLDAVLADRTCTWLGTESDKRSHFIRELRGRVELAQFPRLTFGNGTSVRQRYFPDKLPIGITGRNDYVFVYLVTSPMPMDFRLFLLRHSGVLRGLYRWTIRVLVPAPFASTIRLFGPRRARDAGDPVRPHMSTSSVRCFATGNDAATDPKIRPIRN
jgi:hypothetical protein